MVTNVFFLKITDKCHGVAHVFTDRQIRALTARKDCVEVNAGGFSITYMADKPKTLLDAILKEMASAECSGKNKGCAGLVVDVDKIAGGAAS